MEAVAELLKRGKLYIGLAADILTFGGGLLLARDAFRHLVELRQKQLEDAFHRRFPKLGQKMADGREAEAILATSVARRGLILLAFGFLCELLTRFAE